ncbi:Rossmann-fold NAD(P)-binding domain-containing protein [Algoriphagus resistens]|uniref:epimerase n=1 Tax=Algoriphagus resistens TaxID=1750590 RepID=UPI000716A85D|nr:epimerase [Algoriphagus resistens]
MELTNQPVSVSKPTVAIAGAGGYVGSWFIFHFRHKYNIVALSRKKVKDNPYPEVTWKQVELYSISSTVEVLRNVDVALYLVHSMNSSTRLNQGSFEDTDLLLADNFSRAAHVNKVKQLIYLGGLLPKETGDSLSRHLKSRLEVEHTLGSRSAKLTAIRASIIVGPGGSSFDMIRNLVKNLPILMCPKWTESLTQPISLRDTLDIIDTCVANENVYGEAIEIGSPEVISYRRMLELTAKELGKKRWIFSVPVFSLGLSKLWVGFFGESPPQLVSPLVESLKHTLTVSGELEFREKPIQYLTYEESVREALNPGTELKSPRFFPLDRIGNTVRSIQRMANPHGNSAAWIARRYNLWLPTFLKFWVNGEMLESGEIIFYLLWSKKPMLQLTLVPDRSEEHRQLFFISGGWLVKRFDHGWLEFRGVMDNRYILTAIHEFVPRLPWLVYVNTQAKIHLWVMNRFKKYLENRQN